LESSSSEPMLPRIAVVMEGEKSSRGGQTIASHSDPHTG
jgi:hypothetical protein